MKIYLTHIKVYAPSGNDCWSWFYMPSKAFKSFSEAKEYAEKVVKTRVEECCIADAKYEIEEVDL